MPHCVLIKRSYKWDILYFSDVCETVSDTVGCLHRDDELQSNKSTNTDEQNGSEERPFHLQLTVLFVRPVCFTGAKCSSALFRLHDQLSKTSTYA